MLLADVYTLLLAILAVSLTLGVAIIAEARGNAAADLRWWAAAMLLHGISYVLYMQRGMAPDWLTVIVANVLLSGSFALMLVATARFKAVTLPRSLFWGPPLVVALLFSAFLDHQQARLVIGSAVFLLQQLPLLYLLLRHGDHDRGSGQALLVAGIAVISAVFLVRGVGVVLGAAPIQTLMTQTPLQTVSYLLGIVALLLASLGFVFMVKERVENRERHSRHLLATIFDSSDESIAMFHRDGTLLAINRKGAERFQTTPQKLVGRHMTDVMPPEVADRRLAAIGRVAATGIGEALIDRRANHTYRLTLYPVQGEKERVVVYAEDITEALAAEEALRRSEAHFRAFFERSMVGMATTSLAKGWIAVNDALCDILGYPREELLQKTWAELTHPDDIAGDNTQFERVVAGEIEEYALDKRFIRKDGSVVYAYIAARCVRFPDGGVDYFVALVQDIGERKRHEQEMLANLAHQRELNRKLEEAQNQLLQSEKLASIGQLAAGVAHDLNNPIGFVTSNLSTLDNYLKDIFAIVTAYETADEGPCAACKQLDAARTLMRERDFAFLKTDTVQLMAESADGLARVSKIVRDLKDFSRAGEATAQWADLHQGIDSTLNIVWNELKYKCTVKKEYGELPPVLCVLSQLNQVFMNLLMNAAHAIVEKGEIAIRTGRIDDEVFVAFADTGAGIAPEHLHRIFEPFFTTKPVGKGTGLGLSLAYSIVQKHRGRVEVQSEVGRGTTFTVWLPIEARTANNPAA